MYLQRLPLCLAIVPCDCQRISQSCEGKCVNATFADIVVTCTKRPNAVRCEIVNDALDDLSAIAVSGAPSLQYKLEMDENNDAIFYDADNIQMLMHDATDRPNDTDCVCPTDADTITELQFMFSTDHKWTISLLKILDNMNAPNNAFESIIKRACNAHADGYSFYPNGGQSRIHNVHVLFKSVANAQRLLPSVISVAVPHGAPCNVIANEFAPQLLNLLQNPAVRTAENLLIDIQNPIKPYESPNRRLGDALSGSVYPDAFRRMITDPTRQLFVPIIQWIGRTHITGNGRFSLKPYMFTLAIFKEEFQRKVQTWGYHHGFLPKTKLSSAQNQSSRKQGDNVRNYHAQLYEVLRLLSTAGPKLRNVSLPIGPNGRMQVDVITRILFVIQDMQEGDMLCGRYGTHGPGIQRHNRACDVDHTNLDNPDVNGRVLVAAQIASIARNSNQALRKRWSQHCLNNVFDYVPMADPIRGIYGATPIETMHAFCKGMIEMVTFLILDNVPKSKLAALDAMVIRFHKSHYQTIRRTFPATD